MKFQLDSISLVDSIHNDKPMVEFAAYRGEKYCAFLIDGYVEHLPSELVGRYVVKANYAFNYGESKENPQ